MWSAALRSYRRSGLLARPCECCPCGPPRMSCVERCPALRIVFAVWVTVTTCALRCDGHWSAVRVGVRMSPRVSCPALLSIPAAPAAPRCRDASPGWRWRFRAFFLRISCNSPVRFLSFPVDTITHIPQLCLDSGDGRKCLTWRAVPLDLVTSRTWASLDAASSGLEQPLMFWKHFRLIHPQLPAGRRTAEHRPASWRERR